MSFSLSLRPSSVRGTFQGSTRGAITFNQFLSALTTAGTVVSFTGGILTIMLNDNSTVSGMVTNDTEIECQTMENDVARDGGPGSGDHGDGGDNQGGDDQGGDNQGEDGQSCALTALMPGTTVDGAELQLSGSGATWTKVELG